MQTQTDSPIHDWFGLSYSNYFCIPRSALQAMPIEWQRKFVSLIEEADEMGLETPIYTCQRRDTSGRFVHDEWADYRHPKIDGIAAKNARPR